jgi:hypothetical protein
VTGMYSNQLNYQTVFISLRKLRTFMISPIFLKALQIYFIFPEYKCIKNK